jgi:AraC-like DNA-binding protein
MVFAAGPDGSFPEDLAAELDGVTAEEVEQALEAVSEKNLSEHRQELAEAISPELDGVSVEQVESALAAADERMREAFESGDPPSPDVFTETLADELGLSEDEVADALAAARGATFEAHRDQMEQRLDDAVEEGRLSEKRADEIRERLRSAPPQLEFRSDPGEVGPEAPPPIGAGLPLSGQATG